MIYKYMSNVTGEIVPNLWSVKKTICFDFKEILRKVVTYSIYSNS